MVAIAAPAHPPIRRNLMTGHTPPYIFTEMVRQLRAAQPYLSALEAVSIVQNYGQSTYHHKREAAEQALATRRRAAAGNPVYRPRNDFVGGPRR